MSKPDWVAPKTLDELYSATDGNRFQSLNSDTAGARSDDAVPYDNSCEVNLYSVGTPNGQKASVMLEELVELGLVTYAAHGINIMAGQQFSKGFVDVNPNSKIPAMMHKVAADKPPIRVFESGAILVHLADLKGVLIPKIGDPKRAECLSWVFWQVGGQGPMTGNFGHFFAYAPRDKHEVLAYGVARYGMEVRRLLSVLDRHLAQDDKKWILGDEYSIADIACYPWTETIDGGYRAGDAVSGPFIGTTAGRYPNVNRWKEQMKARPGVQRGMLVLNGKKNADKLAELRDKQGKFPTKSKV